jgi:hypothetical protein
MAPAFGSGAPYLPDIDEPQPNFGYRGPEMSRRARSDDDDRCRVDPHRQIFAPRRRPRAGTAR